jgi:hypothetical protein
MLKNGPAIAGPLLDESSLSYYRGGQVVGSIPVSSTISCMRLRVDNPFVFFRQIIRMAPLLSGTMFVYIT